MLNVSCLGKQKRFYDKANRQSAQQAQEKNDEMR